MDKAKAEVVRLGTTAEAGAKQAAQAAGKRSVGDSSTWCSGKQQILFVFCSPDEIVFAEGVPVRLRELGTGTSQVSYNVVESRVLTESRGEELVAIKKITENGQKNHTKKE